MSLLNPLSWFYRKAGGDASDMHEPLIKPGFWSRWIPKLPDHMPDAEKISLWGRLKLRLQNASAIATSDFGGEAALELKEFKKLYWRRVLLATPSVGVGLMVAAVLYLGMHSKQDISKRYREAGRLAIDDGDVTLARFYYSRLMGEGALGSSQDELNWAMMLTNSGDLSGAMKILDRLAPENNAGFGPAHRYRALLLMNLLRTGNYKVSDIAPRLQWHLKNGAREPIAENHQLWAAFYTITGQADKAIAEQTLAAQQNPDLWVEVAAMCSKEERLDDRIRFLSRAEAHARHSLEINPLDVPRRIMLTKVLVDQKRLDEAEASLKAGCELGDSPELRRALSDMEIVRYEQVKIEANRLSDEELKGRVAMLGKALEIDPSNPAVLKHWECCMIILLRKSSKNGC